MKRRSVLLFSALVLGICLVGCASRNKPTSTDTPGTDNTHSITPDTTPSVIPDDYLPGNDANEGGGAGGTDDSDNGMFDENMDHQNDVGKDHNGVDDNTTNDGTHRDDGVLDDVGDAAGDLAHGAGDAMDGIGDALQKGGNAVGRTISPSE